MVAMGQMKAGDPELKLGHPGALEKDSTQA